MKRREQRGRRKRKNFRKKEEKEEQERRKRKNLKKGRGREGRLRRLQGLSAKESEQQQLVSRLHGLEEAFARCVGRVTQALTAGVVGVSLAASEAAVPRFVLLTPRPGTALLEIFEEPDSNWELVAVELKSRDKNPPVTLDEKNLCLMISGIFTGAETNEGSLAMKCQDQA